MNDVLLTAKAAQQIEDVFEFVLKYPKAATNGKAIQEALDAIREAKAELEKQDSEHVAWLRYKSDSTGNKPPRIKLCDSDDPGAFKVFRHANPAQPAGQDYTALPHGELVGPTPQHYGRDNLMVVAAHRYCLGRSTYVVADCVEWLLSIWNELPDKTKAIIRRDTEEAFERDDEDRAKGKEFKALGMDCDRAEWEWLRKAWNNG